LLGRMLRDSPVRPYRVVSAMNGREGLMKLDLYHPDLVLLDLGMPGMDGYQVLEQVRSQDAWRDLPIVVVSGQDRVDEQERMGGAVTFAKSQGMLPGELLRWLDAVLATCAPSSSVTPE